MGFRETERRNWNPSNSGVIQRIRSLAFPVDLDLQPLPYAHVLDLSPQGHIRPHVDSPRFCGDVVAVLSLMSEAVARFALEKDKVVIGSTN